MIRWIWIAITMVFVVMMHYNILYIATAMISLLITMILFWKHDQLYRSREKQRIMALIRSCGGSATVEELLVKDESLLKDLEKVGLISRRYHG